MKSDLTSELFWNERYELETTRAIDPLGFDALREAMSNVLAPFLTGATRHAEHYVAVMVGLRWAKAQANRPIDKLIWPWFSLFERGLLQYWHLHPAKRPARRQYLGKRAIREICEGERPNVKATILQDQRGVGLLGSYIESLRAIGLVNSGDISINEEATTRLLGDPRFDWNGNSPTSWSALADIFARVDAPRAWQRLGRLLFDLTAKTDEKARMYSAALALKRSSASVWLQLAKSPALLERQKPIAFATSPVAQLEDHLRSLFGELLKGHDPTISNPTRENLGNLAKQISNLDVIELVWPDRPALAKTMSEQIQLLAKGNLTSTTLLQWHLDVMRVRSSDPWIFEVGERTSLRLPSTRRDPDFRLTNLRTLLRETRWAA